MSMSSFIQRDLYASISFGAQIAIGAIFLWSGTSKAAMPFDFLGDVYSYQLVGPKVGVALAVFLPLVEIVVGACLLLRVFELGALVVSMLLCLIFALAQLFALAKGLTIACGCFGGSSNTIVSYATMVRVIAMLAASALSYSYLARRRIGNSQPSTVRNLTDAIPEPNAS